MNHEINMETLSAYFEDPQYTPEEEQLLSDGFIEGKVYHGIVKERIPMLTKNPDKDTGKKMPMILYKINFKLENNVEKAFSQCIVFYPKEHRLHWFTVENKDKFKKATGVDVPNAFASETVFINKEIDATLKKNGQYTEINFINKGVVDEMKTIGQNVPNGNESFDDDIPF